MEEVRELRKWQRSKRVSTEAMERERERECANVCTVYVCVPRLLAAALMVRLIGR